MPRGGARVGAGRPKGSRKTGPETAAIRALLTGGKRYASALAWAMDVINDPDADIEVKSRLAIAAMPYQHPRIESMPANGGKKKQKAKAAEEIQAQPSPFAAPGAPRIVASRDDG